jgi:hypothetical protein
LIIKDSTIYFINKSTMSGTREGKGSKKREKE